MKNLPEINALVVVSHEADGVVFRVKETGHRCVGVIDASIEDKHPNQRIQWVDLSLVHPPSVGQLAAFNQ